jgi:translation initiation factor 3 subunit C
MVQLGLCAFRSNLIKQAHSCLSEMYSSGRVKELLAQGVTSARHNEKNPEQEKMERKRQLPYHMHINLELLEAVHLITAMLLEVPNMAFNAYDPRKKIISKTFRRYLDIHDRQIFTGPPENTRENIIHASKSLSTGDWKKCEQILLSLPVWNLLHNSDQVKAMLRSKIQEEGLRTYLFTYGQHYDSLSLEQLCQMFELKSQNIHQIVSKMMINEEIHASWDQPSQCVVMHKGVDPTRLQYLSQQFADKAAQFVENNERLLDTRTGGYGYKYDQKQQKDGQNQPYRQYTQYGQQGGSQQYRGKKKQMGGNKNQGNDRNERNYNPRGQQQQQNRNRNSYESNQ